MKSLYNLIKYIILNAFYKFDNFKYYLLKVLHILNELHGAVIRIKNQNYNIYCILKI